MLFSVNQSRRNIMVARSLTRGRLTEKLRIDSIIHSQLEGMKVQFDTIVRWQILGSM